MTPSVGRVTVAILCLASAARANTIQDAASGLKVETPPGYVASALPPGRGQAARVEVKTASDTDTGCQIAFTAAPQNSGLSQSQIDTLMEDAGWQDKAKAALSAFYDIRATKPFQAGTRHGLIIIGDFKDRPELPPRAREIRTLFVIQETPRGRTSTVCAGERAGFEAREPEFVAVAAGTTPP